ncbi:hypothetical protein [Nitrosopumilus ureiphilus]|uniref:Uncharacterized protein n=1 Tax=Nitrosopumilus ureiphilus TaxID=1470067 RepID=A0A7D5RCK5_9ARCH|nr:hypothetical protein [Nitrosopumilus ureiphilus]QLH06021.1 hypothetical protein C5F50_02205 [Nitrosopumilus ureiphilus]
MKDSDTPVRDGLRDLRARANKRFGNIFIDRSNYIQQSIEKNMTNSSQISSKKINPFNEINKLDMPTKQENTTENSEHQNFDSDKFKLKSTEEQDPNISETEK